MPSTAVNLDLPYLWSVKGRSRTYYYYRRGPHRIPIEDAQSKDKLAPDDPRFLEAYNRIHATFETAAPEPNAGSLAGLIERFLASPDFNQLAPKTQKDYRRYLDYLKDKCGHLSVHTIPREFTIRLRDKFADKPRTANYMVQVFARLMSYAVDHGWRKDNPAAKPKRLRTGDGHRPWEDWEIAAFRKRWKHGTVERMAFELMLGTGQRSGDVIRMRRQDYAKGEVSVCQNKTSERLWIPCSAELIKALDRWLAGSTHMMILTTETGRPFGVDHFRHVMRDAYTEAALPADCTNHGLRYTAGTVLVEIGCTWDEIAAILGHRTAQMVMKYTRQRRQSRAAIARLDEHRKNAAADRSVNRGVNRPTED